MRRVFPMIVGLSLLGVLGTGPAAAPAFADTYAAPEMTPLLVDQDDVPGDVGESDIGAIDVGADGTAVIAVPGEHMVYEVDSSGEATTVIGTGQAGSVDDEGPATESPISAPSAVARADDGRTYVADGDGTVHVVESDQASPIFPTDDEGVSGDVLSLAVGPSSLYVGTDRGAVHEVEFSGDDATVADTYEVGGHVNGLDVGPAAEVYAAKGSAVVRVDGVTIAETLISADEVSPSGELVDVSVGSEGTVFAASAEGLVVNPAFGDTYVRPTVRGQAVATRADSEEVVVAVGSTANRIRPSESANPVLFPERDVDVAYGEDSEPGTVLPIGDELPAPALSIDIASDGTVGVLHTEGTLDISREAGRRAASTGGSAVGGEEGAIVVGEGDTRYVLSGGEVHRFIDGEYRSTLPHRSGSDGSAEAPGELTRMARHIDRLVVADQSRPYLMDTDGLLTPLLAEGTSLDGEILALAVNDGDSSVYVAVETASIVKISRIDFGGELSDVFDSDDVPGGFDPSGMAVGPNGTLYVTDQESSRILRHTQGQGSPSVIAGDEGDVPADPSSGQMPALEAELEGISAPATDTAGNLVFSANDTVYLLPDAAETPSVGGDRSTVTMSLAVVAVVGVAAGLLLFVRRKVAAGAP